MSLSAMQRILKFSDGYSFYDIVLKLAFRRALIPLLFLLLFLLLGGQGLEYWGVGGKGGANSQQAHDVVTTSHRRDFDVMCPLGF